MNQPISYSATGLISDTQCLAYQVGIATSTPAGTYSTTIIFTAIPSF